ncbi:MAG: hypothetical protein WCS42_05855 [Verrucomicrobiota bacterium]
MSGGVRERELAIVNGDREFAAQFVIDERSEPTTIERRELNLVSTANEVH